MLPDEIQSFCSERFGKVQSFQYCSGGCINNGGKITTYSGEFFVKWNSSTQFPDMFSKEKQGLQLLSKSTSLTIPKVVEVYEGTQYSCLVLEYLNSAPKKLDYWVQLGRGLALLHAENASHFGLDHDNYMGSLKQKNSAHSNWIEFFIHQRIDPQIKLALANNKIGKNDKKAIEALYPKLPDLFPAEKPSLTHGDLWSGNIMPGSNGEPALIDPAVSFAHRETDIAMTQLFGSLPNEFYASYNEINPLTVGWKDRLELYNLYPLLVHVNLFGGGYLSQVMQIVKRYH